MDITEAFEQIVKAKSETIKLQEKYYADIYGLLVDSLRINAALSGAANNISDDTPMRELVDNLPYEEDTSMTGGERSVEAAS